MERIANVTLICLTSLDGNEAEQEPIATLTAEG